MHVQSRAVVKVDLCVRHIFVRKYSANEKGNWKGERKKCGEKKRWVIKRLSQTAHYIIHRALHYSIMAPCTMPINFYLSTTFTSFIFDDDIYRRRSVMGDEIKIHLLCLATRSNASMCLSNRRRSRIGSVVVRGKSLSIHVSYIKNIPSVLRFMLSPFRSWRYEDGK